MLPRLKQSPHRSGQRQTPIRAAVNIPALTGVRAAACLWVVLNHIATGFQPLNHFLGLVLTPGFMGVDLFFILSGFILAIVYAEFALAPRDIAGFFFKRVMRIYPLDIAVMLFMAEEAWRNNWFGTPWYNPHLFLPVLLMIQPFYTNPPFTAWLATNWSTGVELVCYLMFPLLLAVLRRRNSILLLMVLLALAVAEAATQSAYLGAFYGRGAFLRGVVGFSMGFVAAFVLRGFKRPGMLPICAGEVVSLAAWLWFLLQGWLWPLPLCMCGLIMSLSYGTGPIARLFATRWIVWLGEISFSIYLVHGVLLGEFGWQWLATARSVMPDKLASAVWLLGLLSAIVGISAFTYYVIEVPGRHLGRTVARSDVFRLGVLRRKIVEGSVGK